MRRKIIRIHETKCNGCGLCVPNCVEGALKVVNGKARLVSETYCDGLGACLGKCPQDAISIEEREAPEFDEEAVKKFMGAKAAKSHAASPHAANQSCPGVAVRSTGCPGSAVRQFGGSHAAHAAGGASAPDQSALTHWPVQLRLVPPFAPFLKGANILVCADCVPFAVADFHKRYLEGRVVLVGCPKFDDIAYYTEKLAQIITEASPASLTVLRMEVPCCGGLVAAAVEARDTASPSMPVTVDTVGVRGDIETEVIEGAKEEAGD
jgi:Pyruvate/2-oxoacid:ferredoxin oxidoreductase delta subunit